ncbi:hypothetical protein [Yoonia sp.]|uniref:hypothetical protein n=1 Tax=Yoonia sp. TaxID=2212373 RepID=UPI0025E94138|nr:hypothetical protein [Yoonia sp.]
MMRPLILLAFVSVSACATGGPMSIPSAQMSAKDRFVLALENNGCILNQANTAKVLDEATVSADEVTQIITTLSNEGKAEIADGASIRILTERCS